MARRRSRYSEYTPAWARYNGETYVSSFSGTPEQKKEHDKIMAEFFSKHRKTKHRKPRTRHR